ncbi:MAG: sensor histidine kinase [Clostridia bacterium]|nr:sensor histidine kinase [Clostridia bacterium]
MLSNALRHAHTRITVFTEAEESNALISVLDDGDGLSESDLPHLFERNYNGRCGHFGIGLSIVESAIRKCKGSVTAANHPGGAVQFLQSDCRFLLHS